MPLVLGWPVWLISVGRSSLALPPKLPVQSQVQQLIGKEWRGKGDLGSRQTVQSRDRGRREG